MATTAFLGLLVVNIAKANTSVAGKQNQSAAGVLLPDGYRAVTMSCW